MVFEEGNYPTEADVVKPQIASSIKKGTPGNLPWGWGYISPTLYTPRYWNDYEVLAEKGKEN